MREDMARVIVERPRIGGESGRKNRAGALKGRAGLLEDLPKQEGMGRPHVLSGDYKSLNENLSPLRRYLERQVGRPWNKVYSEISRHLRADNTVQQHVRDHIADFVAVKPRRRSGPFFAAGFRGALWFQPLYVDPKDGLLKRTDRLPEARALRRARKEPPAPPDRIALTPERELRRIDGLWFEVTFAQSLEPECPEIHAGKRALARRELRRYGLSNRPT